MNTTKKNMGHLGWIWGSMNILRYIQYKSKNFSGDNVDYSRRFITDRQFELVDELHVWADEITITISFVSFVFLKAKGSFNDEFLSTLSSVR